MHFDFSNAYNRYVKVFWNNESATLDGICNIMRGREASESITEGKLNVTLPLATTHRVDVDFKYDVREISSSYLQLSQMLLPFLHLAFYFCVVCISFWPFFVNYTTVQRCVGRCKGAINK